MNDYVLFFILRRFNKSLQFGLSFTMLMKLFKVEFAQKKRHFKNEKREEKEEKEKLQFSFHFLLHLTFQFEML